MFGTNFSDFYQSALGQNFADGVCVKLRSVWPEDKKNRNKLILGISHFTVTSKPEDPIAGDDYIIAMPETTNILFGNKCSTHIYLDEERLPFDDHSFDWVVAAHYLENSPNMSAALREIWRILEDDGHAVFIIPNRFSPWSVWPQSLLSISNSYSRIQFVNILRRHFFEVESYAKTGFMPPIDFFSRHDAHKSWDIIGDRFWPALGAMLMIKVRKKSSELIASPSHLVQRRRIPVKPKIAMRVDQTKPQTNQDN